MAMIAKKRPNSSVRDVGIAETLRAGFSERWRSSIALIFAGLILLVFEARKSFSIALAEDSPALASMLDPANSYALSLQASRLLNESQRQSDRHLAIDLAERSLAIDPVQAQAAGALGLAADVGGDQTRARQLFRLSERFSKRELATELWLIQDSVNNGDVVGAIRHYDYALRTSDVAPGMLFPVLLKAANEPAVADALVPVIKQKPWWADPFVQYFAKDGDLDMAGKLLRAQQPGSGGSNAMVVLTQRLVAAKRYAEAWQLYQTHDSGSGIGSDSPTSALLSGNRLVPRTPSPFEWELKIDGGPQASIGLDEGRPSLAFSAPFDVGGSAAKRLLLFGARAYNLSGTVVTASPGVRPYFHLSCAANDETLADVPLPDRQRAFQSTIIVPENCPAQWIELILPPTDNPAGVAGEISDLSITPVGASGR